MQHQNQTHININLKVGKGAPSFLYRTLENALSRGISTFKVRIQNPEKGIYPNFCVPIAGIVRHFEEAHACTFLSSKSLDEKHYVGRTGILHPYEDPSSSKKKPLPRQDMAVQRKQSIPDCRGNPIIASAIDHTSKRPAQLH